MKHELAQKIALVLILILALVQLFSSVLISSPNDKTFDRTPKFTWYGGYQKYNLLVDNDPEFNSPEIDVITEGDSYIPNEKLDPGDYYWKVIGYAGSNEVSSITGNFALKSYVAYSREDDSIINTGNVISNLVGITGASVLKVNNKIKLKDGEYYLEQDE